MKIATCTPYPFSGEARFFTRDTGLLCRGLQAAGHDCVVVMPGERTSIEPDDLIRCSESDLRDPGWWRRSERECVILYAWGDPRYLAVARAIRSAGIFLIQSLDTAGLHTPFNRNGVWLQATLKELAVPNDPIQRIKRVGRVVRDFLPQAYERSRLAMMGECDLLAAVSPPAGDYIKSYAEALGRCDIALKVVVIPHPVSPEIQYRGESKKDQLILVGRWGREDAPQKDPAFAVKVVVEFLTRNSLWHAVIVGPMATALSSQFQIERSVCSSRVACLDFIPHSRLREIYAESKISLCASRYESFHIASGEALCSGCSIVVPNSPLLASTQWFTGQNSGTVAVKRDKLRIVEALSSEAEQWELGFRDPEVISRFWSSALHANKIRIPKVDY